MPTGVYERSPEEKMRLARQSWEIAERRKGKSLPERTRKRISTTLKRLGIMPHQGLVKGKYQEVDGYILVSVPNHPYANHRGYVREHRLIIEEHLVRYLDQEEIVHHINGIPDDNRLENLRLFVNHSEHSRFHAELRKEG